MTDDEYFDFSVKREFERRVAEIGDLNSAARQAGLPVGMFLINLLDEAKQAVDLSEPARPLLRASAIREFNAIDPLARGYKDNAIN